MAEGDEVSSFLPAARWLEDWPHVEDTSVQVEATVSGPAADRAVERFLAPLTEVPDGSVAVGRIHF